MNSSILHRINHILNNQELKHIQARRLAVEFGIADCERMENTFEPPNPIPPRSEITVYKLRKIALLAMTYYQEKSPDILAVIQVIKEHYHWMLSNDVMRERLKINDRCLIETLL